MVTRKKAAAKATAKKPAARRRSPPAGILLPVSHEERWRMIAEAAYYLAQRRGFLGEDAVDDWLSAEAEVDRKLRAEGREPR